jgi:hypothetical protein
VGRDGGAGRLGCTLVPVLDPAAPKGEGGARRRRWETLWDARGQAVGQLELVFEHGDGGRSQGESFACLTRVY